MKIGITGASAFVRRMYEACGKYQWAREFLKNSIEAGATRVEFGLEWQAVKKLAVYRRTVIDDGVGMSAKELLQFFSTLGVGSKPIGGVHDNFGVGAKIAALPWNEDGVVVVSYKDGHAAMIWIRQDPDTGDYELRDWEDEDGHKQSVIDPDEVDWEDDEVDWSELRPDWLTDHGTIVVLLGNASRPDTVLGNVDAGETTIKGLTIYLNERFWDLAAPKLKVVVAELRSPKKTSWPTGPDDRDDQRRPNNRTVHGAQYFLCTVEGKEGKLEASDTVLLDAGRVKAHWYLWSGKRPQVHSFARETGYIAIKYGDELYEHTSHKAHFRWFGIIEKAVQDNLTIILEPQLYQSANGRWGIHPDQSRTRLIFTGNGVKGAGLPTADWGAEFANELPVAILEAIAAARKSVSGSLEDDEYRRRLQDKFGSRWRRKVILPLPKGAKVSAVTGSPTTATANLPGPPTHTHGPHKGNRKIKKKRRASTTSLPVLTAGGSQPGVEREVAVDLPRWVPAKPDDFTQPWHLAAYSPNAPGGPVVQINVGSKILLDLIQDHQQNYPDHLAEDVKDTVIKVFGEVAVAKVAHAQSLTYEISEQEVDDKYRNEEALTVALMGLIAEESLIAQRLGRLGRKTKGA